MEEDIVPQSYATLNTFKIKYWIKRTHTCSYLHLQYGKTFSCERNFFKEANFLSDIFHPQNNQTPILIKMLKYQNKLNLKMLLWIENTQTPLMGLKKNHNLSTMPVLFYYFLKNTKLQLYKSTMQKSYWKLSGYKIQHETQTHVHKKICPK